MEPVYITLTVYFEDPFWVGVYERTEGNRQQACRVVFGAEPKDYTVYAWFLEHWRGLRFGSAVPAERRVRTEQNPKRAQRAAAKALLRTGIGTKAQQALKLLQEEGKAERKTVSRARAEAEEERHFLIRQQKKKEKHKGR